MPGPDITLARACGIPSRLVENEDGRAATVTDAAARLYRHFTGTVTERLVVLPKKSLHWSVMVYNDAFLGRRRSLSGPVIE